MTDPGHGEAEAERQVLRALRLAIELTLVVLVVESVGAVLSRSLSLTVDAVHNVPDALAFAVSYFALRSAGEGTSDSYTFGTHRAEVFAGLANAALVLATGLLFAYVAVDAFVHGGTYDGPVSAEWLLFGAAPTLVLRGVTAVRLGRIPGRVRDLNFRSVVLHVASDMAIGAAIVLVGVVLLLRPGANWVDPAAALGIAVVLVVESAPLFRDSWEVLSERTPRHLSVPAIERTALAVPGVTGIHDVHVWAVCPTLVCLTAHVGVKEMTVRGSMEVVGQLRDAVAAEHGILHAVFEVEAAP
ncbi:MAG TPA: cation diffusion facilitator family transporter [Thermoplasmata archaeon]|nr:cation diffusion facilitator family transporter [Thermoplasmata archaeon]